MKRSEINQILCKAEEFFAEKQFVLPPWAFWQIHTWKENLQNAQELIDNSLGWDITDFGLDDFYNHGLLLFTMRNGNIKKDKKPYAEKIMIVEEEQKTPLHFHWSKMEDIINRGGGNLVFEFYNSKEDGQLESTPVVLKTDGILRTFEPGAKVFLSPGESISVEQGVYHCFYGDKGKGRVLVGEVSMVNDDATDNRFYEDIGRFPQIIEDEAPRYLLSTDYERFLK